MSRADTRTRLLRRLRPRSKASQNVRRILRRMRHYGGGTPPMTGDAFHRRRRPGTWIGILNMILQRRAKARKARR